MWPWEHLAVGYILLSLWWRAIGAGKPSGRAALALAVATQLPDLIDKPLGWGTTLLPSGHSLAHSLLFAVPAVVSLYLLARTRDARDVGIAFAVGYLSHLPGDMVYPLLVGGNLGGAFLVWPLIPADATISTSVFGRAGDLFWQFLAFLGTPRGLLYLGFEALLVGTAVLVWYLDGLPGLRAVERVVVAVRHS